MEIQLERQVWALVRHGDARPRLTYAFTYFRWTASARRRTSSSSLRGRSRPTGIVARKRHSTARLQTNALPSRDGSEQFGSNTQAHGQI
jgi:hypothetical protein